MWVGPDEVKTLNPCLCCTAAQIKQPFQCFWSTHFDTFSKRNEAEHRVKIGFPADVEELVQRAAVLGRTGGAEHGEGTGCGSPEQGTTCSSSCPRWRPHPHTPLCQTDPRSAAGRSPLPRWRMKTAPLPDCGWDGNVTLQTA